MQTPPRFPIQPCFPPWMHLRATGGTPAAAEPKARHPPPPPLPPQLFTPDRLGAPPGPPLCSKHGDGRGGTRRVTGTQGRGGCLVPGWVKCHRGEVGEPTQKGDLPAAPRSPLPGCVGGIAHAHVHTHASSRENYSFTSKAPQTAPLPRQQHFCSALPSTQPLCPPTPGLGTGGHQLPQPLYNSLALEIGQGPHCRGMVQLSQPPPSSSSSSSQPLTPLSVPDLGSGPYNSQRWGVLARDP